MAFENYDHLDFLRFPNRQEPGTGSLLVANPMLRDKNFSRTVVLITQHSTEGTIGFVLSKEINLSIAEVSEELQDLDAPIRYGGPVQMETLHFIHQDGLALPDSEEVAPGVLWGRNFHAFLEKYRLGALDLDPFRFFIGYSGWDAGQLEKELESESWIVVPATAAYVFNTRAEDLWSRVMQDQGQPYAMMTNFPKDPRFN